MANRVVFRFLVVMLMVLPQIGHAACAWVLWKKHAAPLVDIGHIAHDLVAQVPREDDHIVRAGLPDMVGIQDR